MEVPDTVQHYEQALRRLARALGEPESAVVRDLAIRRFELTFELAWKATHDLLRDQGILCRSPRECFCDLSAFGLIRDNPRWTRMMEDRDLAEHTYNELAAQRIYANLKDYLPLFDELLRGLFRHLPPSY